MADATSNKYTENQTIPTQLEYPLLGAGSGMSRRKNNLSYYRNGDGPTSIEELVNATNNQSNSIYSSSGLQVSPDMKNEILNIPSFLSYPSDLGTNRRHHHFIVFNIYQGSSDQIRLKTREYNQVTSAILAKGGVQFATQTASGGLYSSLGGSSEIDMYNGLIRAGFSQPQADEYSKALFSSKGLQSTGLTSDEFITSVDDLGQGNYTNSEGPDSDIIGGLLGSPLALGKNIGSLAYTAGAFVGESTGQAKDFIVSLTEASLRNNLDPVGMSQRDYNARGASGRSVYRPRAEQNILLANRRFNNANVKSKDTIFLYMPLKITFNDQLIYSEEDMGSSKMILDAMTGKRGAVSAVIEKVGRKGIADMVSGIGSLASNVPLAGGAIQGLLDETNVGAVRAAQQRTVANPRKEMMFRDVALRTHSFSFEFNPNNPQEAETVLNIIRMLRYHSYPGLQGGGGHFFTFPAEFELSFYTVEDSGFVVMNDNLPKLPRLALQSIAVDYSGAGDYKTFHDGKPAFIKLDLTFQEMEQLTNEHIVHGY